ncbi:MAG: aspartate aminotransferase family protein [Flavobacteriaceae bacterium]|nr:aspartate aminotransferase family protein [Flavobacteriaceae bacterium]
MKDDLVKKDIKNLFHPATNLKAHEGAEPLILEKGDGIYVYDKDGNKYIEGLAGLWCNALGFGNQDLVETAANQMQKYAYGSLFASKSHEPAIMLSEKLVEMSPYDSGKVFFGNSGSDANDTQYKLFTYLNNALGKPKKKKFLARKRGYHGITLASGSMTGIPANHKLFDMPIDGFFHTDTPHYYSEGQRDETESQFLDRIISNLQQLIEAEDPTTFSAMIAEPLIGAGGVLVPPQNYFPRAQEVLDQYDIPLISDEVVCGFGRTGNIWGLETFNMKPSSITIAKALSSGYMPISAVIIPDEIFEPVKNASNEIGVFGHGYTYSGHPVACAVALRTLEIYEETNLFTHAKEMSFGFQSYAHKLDKHEFVGEVRGVGMVAGIEFVENKETKKPFMPIGKMGQLVAKICQKNGLIVRAIGDTIAICPPLIITEEQIHQLFDILDSSIEEASKQI